MSALVGIAGIMAIVNGHYGIALCCYCVLCEMQRQQAVQS